MPTTPNYSLPYPLETDDADVPVDMQELADAVDGVMLGRWLVDAKGDLLAGTAADTVARVPAGSNGQVLSSDGASAAGLKWVNLAGAYVPVTLPDAKGDLFGATGPDAPARVAVGADGTVLTADTAQALGVKWATPPPSGIQPGIIDAKGDLIVGQADNTPARLAPATDGQVLTLDSAVGVGVKWATPAAGGSGIPPATVDAKGDLIVGSANDLVSRLGAGADGTVLTADAAQALGLKWAAVAGGGGGGVDHKGTWAAGTAYLGGDVVTYNGVDYLAVNASTGQTPPAAIGGGVGIGTALPAAGDGTEYVLVDSLTAPTYAWRFKYVASISDAYKWLCVGGAAALVEVPTAESAGLTTAAYNATTTPGPSFTVPRAGIYTVAHGFTSEYVSGANVALLMSYDIGATGAVDADAARAWMTTMAVQFGTSPARERAKTLTAGTALVSKYRYYNAGGSAFSNRWLRVMPVRVT